MTRQSIFPVAWQLQFIANPCSDPEMADFSIDTMAVIALECLVQDQSSHLDVDEEDRWYEDDSKAWADVGCRLEIWCGLRARVDALPVP